MQENNTHTFDGDFNTGPLEHKTYKPVSDINSLKEKERLILLAVLLKFWRWHFSTIALEVIWNEVLLMCVRFFANNFTAN